MLAAELVMVVTTFLKNWRETRRKSYVGNGGLGSIPLFALSPTLSFIPERSPRDFFSSSCVISWDPLLEHGMY